MLSELFDGRELREAFPELRLLVLHGSRARGDAHADSDWDFAYLADKGMDEPGLRAMLLRLTGASDRGLVGGVDLVDLGHAGGLVRYRAARDGKLLFERDADEHERFVLEAVRFWLDAERAIQRGYEDVLERLG